MANVIPLRRRTLAPRKLQPVCDPVDRAQLFDAYLIAKAAYLSVPMLRAAGLAADLCDELDKATSERATRLLAQLAANPEGAA